MSWTWLYLSSSASALEAPAEEQQLHQLARIERRRIGRRHVQDRLDEPRHLDHRLAVFVVRLGVELRVPRDLAARLRVIVHAPEIVAVRHRRERAVERQNLEAVPRQIEIADDLRPQQRHDVRADRELEAGKYFFRHGGAAERRAAARARAPSAPRGPDTPQPTRPLWPPPMTMALYFMSHSPSACTA